MSIKKKKNIVTEVKQEKLFEVLSDDSSQQLSGGFLSASSFQPSTWKISIEW